MADIAVAHDKPVYERTGFRLSWGAIFAGLFVAIGLHLILALLGIAVGLTALDPASADGPSPGGIAGGVGIWAAVSGLIALFVGGTITGRLAGILTRKDGALHGVILWAVSTVMLLWMVISGMGFLLGGAFNVVGQTASSAIGAVGAVAPEIAGPAVTGTVQGQERQTMVSEIAARTGLSYAQADSLVSDVESRAQDARERISMQMDTLRERAPEMAEDASDAAAMGAWWALLALGLSLAAAAFGASTTARE
jgi:hypothetical protein